MYSPAKLDVGVAAAPRAHEGSTQRTPAHRAARAAGQPTPPARRRRASSRSPASKTKRCSCSRASSRPPTTTGSSLPASRPASSPASCPSPTRLRKRCSPASTRAAKSGSPRPRSAFHAAAADPGHHRSQDRPARDPRGVVDPLAGTLSIRSDHALPRQRATVRRREQLAARVRQANQRRNGSPKSDAALTGAAGVAASWAALFVGSRGRLQAVVLLNT